MQFNRKMKEARTYNPSIPDFSQSVMYETPTIQSMDDYRDAVHKSIDETGVWDLVEGAEIMVVARNLDKILKSPIPHGNYRGNPRFISESVAKKLGVDAVEYPKETGAFLGGGTAQRRMMSIAYYQGSSEYASNQQQSRYKELGYAPFILESNLKHVVQEELEHGTQMAYWLGVGSGASDGWIFVEDLLARKADSLDPERQQPLKEFNPQVLSLPEIGHYFDKQDRDGASQLLCSRDNGDVLYSGQMNYFLKQEGRHLAAGQQLIELYLITRKIPMDLHLKLEWLWDSIGFRLHGNPYASDGAKISYNLGSKNPIFPLNKKEPNGEAIKFRIPHRDYGFLEIEVSPEMDTRHLNGLAVSYMRNKLIQLNIGRSKLLDDAQRNEMREFLIKATKYVSDKNERQKIIESGVIPTAEISWRPPHLALGSDPWYHLDGYYTDVFGYPIPSFEEYLGYREIIDLSSEDREKLLEITRIKGWMAEFLPGDKQDVYREGITKPDEHDHVFYRFKIEPKRR